MIEVRDPKEAQGEAKADNLKCLCEEHERRSNLATRS